MSGIDGGVDSADVGNRSGEDEDVDDEEEDTEMAEDNTRDIQELEELDSTIPYQNTDPDPGEGTSTGSEHARPNKRFKVSQKTQVEVMNIEREKVELLREIRDTLRDMCTLMKEPAVPDRVCREPPFNSL